MNESVNKSLFHEWNFLSEAGKVQSKYKILKHSRKWYSCCCCFVLCSYHPSIISGLSLGTFSAHSCNLRQGPENPDQLCACAVSATLYSARHSVAVQRPSYTDCCQPSRAEPGPKLPATVTTSPSICLQSIQEGHFVIRYKKTQF